MVLWDFKTFFRVFWVQNKTGICLIYFFIEKVEKISSIKTLKIWKTETQTETENQVIYTLENVKTSIVADPEKKNQTDHMHISARSRVLDRVVSHK